MIEPFIGFLYNSNNDRIETDLEPLVYDEWSSAEREAPENLQWFSIIERASSLLDSSFGSEEGKPRRRVASKTRKPFDKTNAVMDIQLDDGQARRSAFVRVLMHHDEDPSTEMWKRARLFSELSILRWLQANASDLPVPRVLAFDDVNDLLITTLMPGLDAAHAYPRLSTPAKQNSVISWAGVSVLMFRLDAPQRRFSIINDPLVQPASYLSISPQHTFATDELAGLLSFFTSAIPSRRARSL
ncbi:hypothetical protein C8R44DRAFT_860426, partial [Mycena epipterygia]